MIKKLQKKDQIKILLRSESLDEEIEYTAKKVRKSQSVLRATATKFAEVSFDYSDSK